MADLTPDGVAAALTGDDPAPDPDKDELAQLRKEKAERDAAEREKEKAERDAKDAELEQLRKEKAERDAAEAKKVATPKTKEEKAAAAPPPADEPPAKRKARVSSRWFGDKAYED